MLTSPDFLAEVYVLYLARAIVALLLILGSLGKLANFREFREVIYAYNILPKHIVPLFSYAIPLLELVTGIALLFNLLSPATELSAAGLFCIFIIAIAGNLLRGHKEIACGCFGGKLKNISWHLVARNAALAGLALFSSGRFTIVALPLFTIYGLSLIVSVIRSKVAPVRASN